MAEAGVDGALIHPPFSWDPTSNALSIEACRKYPDRFAILGQFPPGDRSNEKLISAPGGSSRHAGHALGIRLWRRASRQLQEGQFDWIWPAVEKGGPCRPAGRQFPRQVPLDPPRRHPNLTP